MYSSQLNAATARSDTAGHTTSPSTTTGKGSLHGPAVRPNLGDMSMGSGVSIQRRPQDAVKVARTHLPTARFSSFEEVHQNKDQFSAEEWASIVNAYNKDNDDGVRLRNIPPQQKPALTKPTEKNKTLSETLYNAAATAGNINTLASGMEHVVANPLSEAIAHVPVLGGVSSLRTAIDKKSMADKAYLKGNLVDSTRHQIGSVASGLKAGSDMLTAATGGISAPLTVPVSAALSTVNTVTNIPEYVQSAQSIYTDPLGSLSKAVAKGASIPGAIAGAGTAASKKATAALSYFTNKKKEKADDDLVSDNTRTKTVKPDKSKSSAKSAEDITRLFAKKLIDKAD